MPSFALFEMIGWAARLLFAQGIIFLFLLMNLVSFSIPHAGEFKPFFLLMVIYYWSIYRPTLIPIPYTFFLGLILDFLSELPIGLSALLLVSLQTMIQKSRLFLMGQNFMMVWLGFGMTAFAYAIALWILMSVAMFQFASSDAMIETLAASLISVLFFPVAALTLQGVHRLLPVPTGPLRAA